MNGVCTLLFALAVFSVARATTYVANAFRYPIFVMVDADKTVLTKAAAEASVTMFGFGGGVGGSMEWEVTHTAKSNGFTAIDCQKSLPFEPDTSKHVYISIFTYVNGKKHLITDGFPFIDNRGVLVNDKAFMNVAQNNDPWVEADGTNHKLPATKAITTVANAYAHPIYVMVDANEAKLRSLVRKLKNNSISVEGREDGFTIINPQEPHQFDRQHCGNMYISVVSFKEGKRAIIAEAYSTRPGRGVIVNSNGAITLAREGAVWVDSDGYDHREKKLAKIVKGITVANVHRYPIHVMARVEKMDEQEELDKMKAYAQSVGEGIQSDKYHIWNPLGYKSIDTQEAHTFETEQNVFITAFVFVDGGEVKTFYWDTAGNPGRGIIICEDQITVAEAGKIWVDYTGVNHKVNQMAIYM